MNKTYCFLLGRFGVRSRYNGGQSLGLDSGDEVLGLDGKGIEMFANVLRCANAFGRPRDAWQGVEGRETVVCHANWAIPQRV